MRGFMIILVPIVVVGATFAQPGRDTLWTRTYGGPNEEVANSVRQTPDGGYIIAGVTTRLEDQLADIYLVRISAQGDTVWTRQYGEGQYNDIARSLEVTSDGGYVLAGSTHAPSGIYTDMYLIRTDSEGYTLWTRTYGGLSNEEAFAVKQTGDGGYILVGWTGSYGPEHRNVYIVKTDAAGDTLWTQVYGTGGVEEAWTVQQTTDGGYVIAGFADGQREDTDMYLLRTDSHGDTLWTRKYGGPANEDAHAILQTSDGTLAIAGLSWSYGPPAMYLVKTDEMGNMLWDHSYGMGSDEAQDIQQTADGGFVLAGSSVYWEEEVLRYDAELVRTDNEGDTLWTAMYGDSGSQTFNSVRITDDGGYILAGSTDLGPGGVDFYVVRTGSEVNAAPPGMNRQSSTMFYLTASPNPFNHITEIAFAMPQAGLVNLAVYDETGRLVEMQAQRHYTVGKHRVLFNGSALASGVYFARVHCGTFSATQRLVLLK